MDEKFIDAAYLNFETIAPGKNHFLVVTQLSELRYIKEAIAEIVTPKRLLTKSVIGTFSNYEFIVLHSLHKTFVHLVEKLMLKIPIVWIGFGFDYYDLVGRKENLFLPETKSLVQKIEKENMLLLLKSQLKKMFLDGYRIRKKKSILPRIDFFSPVIYEDYEIVKENLSDFKPRYIPWNYSSGKINILAGDLTGNNILVGNSASPMNNHLEVFNILKSMDLSGRKIICPLSYGNLRYREHILKAGYDLFPNRFLPLLEFMPPAEYVKIVRSCSIGVMNHLRQQAAGNVGWLLVNGSKCFMQECNPLYSNRKKLGLKIYPMTDFTSSNLEVFKKLIKEEVLMNKTIIQENGTLEVAINKTQNLIKTVMDYKFQQNMGKA